MGKRPYQHGKPGWISPKGYQGYIDSPKWRALRLLVLARDREICQSCAHSDRVLHVHHIHYGTLGIETGEELVSLCRACHAREHRDYKLRDREEYWLGMGLPAVRPPPH